MFQYSKNYEGTKTIEHIEITETMFQYSKNYEGTKTNIYASDIIMQFQYSKNYEGTKTSKILYTNIIILKIEIIT